MIIALPKSVAFPVTISQLLKQQGDAVPRMTPLLTYTFKSKTTEIPEFGTEVVVEKLLTGQFDAPLEGNIERWLVAPGTVIENHLMAVVEIEEPCTHEVQFSGLCAVCGKDMTETYYNSYFADSERATIQVAHDNTGLTISDNEARKHEEEAKRRLLKERKLSLVVDLDQTIIHATVDPTVGDWKDDPYCVNHESVKDVEAFKLDEDVSGGRGTWYYVKMRPGLKDFLQRISKLYELHIYTMGTRAYAMAVKKIVDPDGSIFGERVLSRDESGSMTQKSLARLFPVDTKMVVIIDDRGDVWKWSENLVRVRPYDFFVGIGDINSMFLPKKQEYPAAVPAAATPAAIAANSDLPIEKKEEEEEGLGEDVAAKAAAETAMDTDMGISPVVAAAPTTLETLITMGGGSNPQVLTDQTEQLDKVIEAQKEARPLAKKQELQDKIDEKAAELAALTESGGVSDTQSEGGAQKHSVLQDNDYELGPLETHLTEVHQNFFAQYDVNKGEKKDRVSQLKDVKKHPRKRAPAEDPDGLDLSAVPDVAEIMPTMKRKTLSGCVLVFSGVIPIGADIHSSDIALWASSFGAKITDHVSPSVTHVIAARTRTAKVRQAARHPHIKIVTPGWLYDSISHWKIADETPYTIYIHPEDRQAPNSPSLDITMTNPMGPLLSSEDEDSDSDESEDSEGFESDGTADKIELDMSNIGWKDVDEEFAEFFGEDDLESDTESVKSNKSTSDPATRKRSAPEFSEENTDTEMSDREPSGDEGEDSNSADAGSRLAKRQKVAKERADAGSSLKVVEGTESTTPPSPQAEENDEDFDDNLDLAEDLDRELFALDEEEEAERQIQEEGTEGAKEKEEA